MGAALIRKCWDVQEEKWSTNQQYEKDSTDYNYQDDYYQNNQTKNPSTNRSSI
jgi:hypothetical protein